MSKKNKKYGFPYDYSKLKPIHSFVNEQGGQIKFYRETTKYVMLQITGELQQRLFLDSTTMNNMMSKLDKNGWKEVSVF